MILFESNYKHEGLFSDTQYPVGKIAEKAVNKSIEVYF